MELSYRSIIANGVKELNKCQTVLLDAELLGEVSEELRKEFLVATAKIAEGALSVLGSFHENDDIAEMYEKEYWVVGAIREKASGNSESIQKEINWEKLINGLMTYNQDEKTRKEELRNHHIEQGYGKKAINTSEDGRYLFGSLWSLVSLKEYGATEEEISEIKLRSHQHPYDEDTVVTYVWADSIEQAMKLLDDGNSSSTGDVNEEGCVNIGFLGEYC